MSFLWLCPGCGGKFLSWPPEHCRDCDVALCHCEECEERYATQAELADAIVTKRLESDDSAHKLKQN